MTDIARAVTAKGRALNEQSQKLIREKFTMKNGYEGDARIIYGDTVSLIGVCIVLTSCRIPSWLFLPTTFPSAVPLNSGRRPRHTALHFTGRRTSLVLNASISPCFSSKCLTVSLVVAKATTKGIRRNMQPFFGPSPTNTTRSSTRALKMLGVTGPFLQRS